MGGGGSCVVMCSTNTVPTFPRFLLPACVRGVDNISRPFNLASRDIACTLWNRQLANNFFFNVARGVHGDRHDVCQVHLADQ